MSNSLNSTTTPEVSLADLNFLNGLQTEFNSIAEMISVRSREIPDRIHVSFYDQKITYKQTQERSNRVANFLQNYDVKKGEIISLMIMNSPEIYDCMFGIQKLGAIAGSINFALKAPELAYILDDSKPRIVFVGSDFMAEFVKGVDMADHKPLIVEVESGVEHPEVAVESTLNKIMKDFSDEDVWVPQQLDDPFLLLYSSGTTGQPKGILLTNRAQFSICRDMARLGLVEGNDVMLILLPMFHINPICVWTFPMTFCGQTLSIRKAFSPADFWPAIIENNVTILMGVPAMYNYVYYSIDPATVDMEKLKLRWAFCGAAPLSVDLIKGFKEKFNVDIIEGYGLTEGTGVSAANPPIGVRKPGSIGKPLSEQQIEIMDEHLKILATGDRGEICIKSEANMKAYLNRPEATAETLSQGWLRTGDIGYKDEDGFLYIVDRKKDMINRGGENIYPREIESVLEAHRDVVAVAVIGIPDEALGEKVKAVLEISQPGILDDAKIKEFLADKMAAYKIPEIIEIIDQLPRNPTGKVLKKELR